MPVGRSRVTRHRYDVSHAIGCRREGLGEGEEVDDTAANSAARALHDIV